MEIESKESKKVQPVIPISDKGIKTDRPKQIFNYRKRMIARNKETIIKTTSMIIDDPKRSKSTGRPSNFGNSQADSTQEKTSTKANSISEIHSFKSFDIDQIQGIKSNLKIKVDKKLDANLIKEADDQDEMSPIKKLKD